MTQDIRKIDTGQRWVTCVNGKADPSLWLLAGIDDGLLIAREPQATLSCSESDSGFRSGARQNHHPDHVHGDLRLALLLWALFLRLTHDLCFLKN